MRRLLLSKETIRVTSGPLVNVSAGFFFLMLGSTSLTDLTVRGVYSIIFFILAIRMENKI